MAGWRSQFSSSYTGDTPWRPIPACCVGLAILWVSLWMIPHGATVLGVKAGQNSFDLVALVQGSFIASSVWVAAGALGGDQRKVLSLRSGSGGTRVAVPLISLLLSLLFLVGFLLRVGLDPSGSSDIIIAESGGSILPSALLLLIVAPISEELLFRGFLLSALHKTPIGFWGASVITSGGWSLIHYSYPIHAILTIFILGISLSVALWRSGSIWTCILLHGLFNAYYVLLLLRVSY